MSNPEDRWLVYDRREELAGKAGTHALVIGVSAYQYLQDGPAETEERRVFGLHRLPAAARSAYMFHNWLRDNAHRLAAPLKTIRLLLAPGPAEVDEIENLDRSGAECVFEDFLQAVYAWRDEASHNREDATVFYFCGNGFDLGPSDPVMALADFGAARGPALRGTVAVNHLIQGLAPSKDYPELARTQLYFIDSGRRRLSFDEFQQVTPPAVFDLRPSQLDDRRLAVCHAASPGERAFGERTTFFLTALLRCLRGAAAVPDPGNSVSSRNTSDKWNVTVNSLVQALPAALKQVIEEAEAPGQQVFVSSMSGDAILVRLDGPPVVAVTVHFGSEEMAGRAVIDIRNADGTQVEASESGETPGRRELSLPAGLYLIHISFPPSGSGTSAEPEKDVMFIASLIPPQDVWEIEDVS